MNLKPNNWYKKYKMIKLIKKKQKVTFVLKLEVE